MAFHLEIVNKIEKKTISYWRLERHREREMVDIPATTEDASGVIIYGVESEQIEEENDAYNDMRAELGNLLTIKQKGI